MCLNELRLVVQSDQLNHREVAITVLIRAIRRVLASDPVIRTRWCTVLEYYEVMIPLATRGINAFSAIEPEHRIGVTPVQWQGEVQSKGVYARLRRFAPQSDIEFPTRKKSI